MMPHIAPSSAYQLKIVQSGMQISPSQIQSKSLEHAEGQGWSFVRSQHWMERILAKGAKQVSNWIWQLDNVILSIGG
jgi:hypothetical protein